MIVYDRLWITLKKKNISQYALIKDYGIDKSTVTAIAKEYGRKNGNPKQIMFHT